ncbi:MAG: SRPBCC family protein [Pseudomonadota bacterium]
MPARSSELLKWALGLNFVLSGVSGLTATFASATVSAMTGLGPTWLVTGVGLGLLVFAAGIALTLLRLRIGQALIISILDLIWVVAMLPLILVPSLLTAAGVTLVLILAFIVGAFGVLQLIGIRTILKEAAEPGRYRHCIRVGSAAVPDKLWSVVRNLGAMSRYSAGLSASRLDGGTEAAAGTSRVCTNHKGQSWTEEVESLDDTERLVLLRFRSEAEDFPFPFAELSGGWSVKGAAGGGSLVDIWWNVQPNQPRLGWLIVAMMTMALDRDVPKIVAAMEADAMGTKPPRPATGASLAYC